SSPAVQDERADHPSLAVARILSILSRAGTAAMSDLVQHGFATTQQPATHRIAIRRFDGIDHTQSRARGHETPCRECGARGNDERDDNGLYDWRHVSLRPVPQRRDRWRTPPDTQAQTVTPL